MNQFNSIAFYFFFVCLTISCGTNDQTKPIIQAEDSTKTNTQNNQNQLLRKIDSVLKGNVAIPVLWNKKATLFLQLQKKDSAIYCFEKTIFLDKKNMDAILALSYLYAEKKNKKALALCEQVLHSDKELLYAKAHYVQGVYYAGVQNVEKAIFHFNSCIQQDWTFIDAYLEKGIVLLQHKRYEEALKIFTLAMKTNNKNPETYYWIGRTNEALHDTAKAILFYKQTLLLDPSFTIARERLHSLEKK